MDVNIAKFNIPIRIRKAFDQGKIDKVYKGIYLLADELAAIDTRRYLAKKPSEYLEEKIHEMKGADSKKTTWSSRVTKQIFTYRQRDSNTMWITCTNYWNYTLGQRPKVMRNDHRKATREHG